MRPDMNTKPAANAAQAARYEQLRRAFRRQVGGRGRITTLEETAINNAARLTAIAEAAATDPSTRIDDLVRVDGAAHRARTVLTKIVDGKRKPAPTLADYLQASP